MLLNDFFEISNISTEKEIKEGLKAEFTATIKLNPNHPIYSGHFPNNPVTPGVCLIQIVRETTELFMKEKFLLSSVSNIKFLIPVKPDITPELSLKVTIKENDEKSFWIDAVMNFGGDTYFKIQKAELTITD